MRIGISNLAWHPHEDERMVSVLRRAGASAVELAPSKLWPDPANVSAEDAATVRAQWERHGLVVCALQSILFGRPDLVLFGSSEARAALLEHLEKHCVLAARLGAAYLVFGSPRNRARGQLSPESALDIAVETFSKAGALAARHGVWLCIEPNPRQYGADFVTDIGQAVALVDAVATEGFGLHFDTACVVLGGDDVASAVLSAGTRIRHFHASEPDLGPVGSPSGLVDHARAGAALRDIGYAGAVSVEMLPVGDENEQPVADALAQAVSWYG